MYKGGFKDGLFEEKGNFKGKEYDYVGEFKEGLFHGYGEKTF